MLCFATAANATGAVVGIIVVDDDVDIADVSCDEAAELDEIDVVTLVLGTDERIAAIADEFI